MLGSQLFHNHAWTNFNVNHDKPGACSAIHFDWQLYHSMINYDDNISPVAVYFFVVMRQLWCNLWWSHNEIMMQPIWGTNNKKIQGLDGALWNLIIDKCVEYLMHVSRVNTSPREESKLWFFIIKDRFYSLLFNPLHLVCSIHIYIQCYVL